MACSTMAWTVPGAIGAKIARPGCRVLVATGDGAFLDELPGNRDRAAAWRAVCHPGSAGELLPTLRTALAADTVSVIACPVDYSANLELIESLGDLDESLS